MGGRLAGLSGSTLILRFCLDHRVCQSRLMKSMDEWMGPALVVYNDAKFTDKDFKYDSDWAFIGPASGLD